MMSVLTIIVGLVFVMLLFSLLASTVLEIISGLLSRRGKHLFSSLESMLGDKTDDFIKHPMFKQLSKGSRGLTGKSAMPSYIAPSTFSGILNDLLDKGKSAYSEVEEKIEALPNGELKHLLTYLNKNADGTVQGFKTKTEEWFNEVMDRASGRFKRSSSMWLLGIGLVVAVLFNVDTVNIYHNLSVNASLRENVADMAEKFVDKGGATVNPALNRTLEETLSAYETLKSDHIAAISSPLGLGWDQEKHRKEEGTRFWLYKLIGLLTTAIAISLGAQFWFDLLKKLMRVSGRTPEQAAAAQQAAPVGTAPVSDNVSNFEKGSRSVKKPG